jgi:integrase
MPRPAKGARLYLQQRSGRAPVWLIKDEGDVRISTSTGDRREAETALAEYIAARNRPSGPLAAEEMTVGQVLTIYGEDYAPTVAAPERIGYAIEALARFWGDLTVSAVKGATCRRYQAQRGVSDGTIRRELGVLQAALNYCATEGHLLSSPRVWKPDPPASKDRYLTRQEVAWLLRASRRLSAKGRHLTRFILIALYTGTRKSAALSLRLDQPGTDGGWIDTERGVLYRQPEGKRQTKKRQPAARMPKNILGHVRRWKTNGARFAIEDWRGNRVADVQTSFASCVRLAEEMAKSKGIELDLAGISPHVLRHTMATWLMQSGASFWDAGGYLGMSPETLERVYGHHHPDHQAGAVSAIESGVSGARSRNALKGQSKVVS